MPGSPSSSVRGGFPLGLAGATLATRYVGAVASGAPASGTFAVGDFVIGRDGTLSVCTVAGSPGTWVALGGGGITQYDYVERTTQLAVAATTPAGADTWITGGAVVYDGSTRIKVEAFAPLVNARQFIQIQLWDGATDLGCIAGMSSGNTADVGVNGYGCRYLTPSAASHTYTLKAYRGGTSGTIYAGSGGTAGEMLPAFLRITKA